MLGRRPTANSKWEPAISVAPDTTTSSPRFETLLIFAFQTDSDTFSLQNFPNCVGDVFVFSARSGVDRLQ